MKSKTGICIFLAILLFMSPELDAQKFLSLDTSKIDLNVKGKTLATVYARRNFEARFMDITATALNTVSAISTGVYISTAGYNANPQLSKVQTINSTTQHKKANNEFEKKLGDFDVLEYFSNSFYKLKDSVKYFDIIFNSDSLQHVLILKQIFLNKNVRAKEGNPMEVSDSTARYFSAFKFQYGIGARGGKEQFGLKKSYRPFVRLVGEIKDVKSNNIVWGNKITVFSEKFYKGRDEAKEEFDFNLVKEFRVICNKLSKILVEDLNGKQYYFPELLVDYTADDDIL